MSRQAQVEEEAVRHMASAGVEVTDLAGETAGVLVMGEAAVTQQLVGIIELRFVFIFLLASDSFSFL